MANMEYVIVRNMNDDRVLRAVRDIPSICTELTPEQFMAQIQILTRTPNLVDRVTLDLDSIPSDRLTSFLKASVAYPVKEGKVSLENGLYGPDINHFKPKKE